MWALMSSCPLTPTKNQQILLHIFLLEKHEYLLLHSHQSCWYLQDLCTLVWMELLPVLVGDTKRHMKCYWSNSNRFNIVIMSTAILPLLLRSCQEIRYYRFKLWHINKTNLRRYRNRCVNLNWKRLISCWQTSLKNYFHFKTKISPLLADVILLLPAH